MVQDKSRNFGLDVMRATAVILVILHHWLPYNFMSIHLFDNYIIYSSLLGYYGVEIFFVLSGFLIGNIILKAFYSENNYNLKVVLTFWMRRWLRTLPLYYLILFINIFISFIRHQHINSVWKFFFFIQNISGYDTKNNDFFGVSWSLSIEEWFYISFPLVLILFNFLFKKYLSKTYILLSIILFYIFGELILRFIAQDFGQTSWNDFFRKAVIAREDSIAFGVLGAYIFNIDKKYFFLHKNWYGILGAAFLITAGFIFFINVSPYYSAAVDNTSVFSKTALFTLVSAGVLLVLPFFYNLRNPFNQVSRSITFVSKISYSLYLIHPIVFLFLLRFIHIKSSATVLVSFVIYICASFGISFITYNLIEKTFLKYRDKNWHEKYKAV